jgi:hypothetical protein
MTNPVDPSNVQLTGENSFIQLADSPDAEPTTRLSHWRVLLSPAGDGHVLFLTSELNDDEVVIYSDNIALARWLQEDIQGTMHSPFGDTSIPIVDAEFGKSGDVQSFWTETVASDDDDLYLTWYDFGDPFVVSVATGSNPDRPHGVYSCLVPARRVQVTINGEVASGAAHPKDNYGKASSTSCLALSETWLRD